MTENNELDMMRAQMHELKQDINRHNMINENSCGRSWHTNRLG